MKRVLRFLFRSGMRRGWQAGILEGNRAWVIVGGVAVVGHLAGRVLGREEEIVFREPLRPGESFRITHSPKH